MFLLHELIDQSHPPAHLLLSLGDDLEEMSQVEFQLHLPLVVLDDAPAKPLAEHQLLLIEALWGVVMVGFFLHRVFVVYFPRLLLLDLFQFVDIQVLLELLVFPLPIFESVLLNLLLNFPFPLPLLILADGLILLFLVVNGLVVAEQVVLDFRIAEVAEKPSVIHVPELLDLFDLLEHIRAEFAFEHLEDLLVLLPGRFVD